MHKRDLGRLALCAACAWWMSACDERRTGVDDAGGTMVDAASQDAGRVDDAGSPRDASPPDGGEEADAGVALAGARVFGGSSACIWSATQTRCWGGHTYGELGIGAAPDVCGVDPCALAPTTVTAWAGAVDIALSFGLGCAALAGGGVSCSGRNHYGQLGIGVAGEAEEMVASPVSVSLTGRATRVVTGGSFACALLDDGTVWCWGSDQFFQATGLGEPDCGILMNRECAVRPVRIAGLTGVVDITGDGSIVGEGHVCAVLSDGTVRCWGEGARDQLGSVPVPDACLSDMAPCLDTPTPVTGVADAVGVDCASNHCCAVLGDGTAMCWGRGSAGKLGNGTEDDAPLAVAVSGLSSAVQIDAGLGHTCARRSDGTVACWGRNERGECGIEPASSDTCGEPDRESACVLSPTTVPGITDATWVSANGNSTCAASADGTVRCWGSNYRGALAQGTEDSEPHPIPQVVP